MEDNICIECGQEMTLIIVKKAVPPISRRIARYECDCGFKISAESDSERIKRVHGYEVEDEERNKGVDWIHYNVCDIE